MQPVLIAGSGPTGLAAALFLSRAGVEVRIVDKAQGPSPWSKALAVNPRTLELLEPTGVTRRILDEGRSVTAVKLQRDGDVLVELKPAELHPKFPMIALPQNRTEAMLAEALAARGVTPQWNVSLEGLEQDKAGVRATLLHADGARETVETPLLFAADGAHSTARHLLDIDFPGSSFPEPWKLADVILERGVEAPDGVQLFDKGFVFAMAFTPAHWRIISNCDDPMTHVPGGAAVKEVVWTSEFHISHRIAKHLAVGRVALGGDAAHLHSPVGARGMNLGIEDAFVFSEIAKKVLAGEPERLGDYGRVRHAADQGVVHRVEAISRMARGEGLWSVVRQVAPHLAGSLPPLRKLMEQTVTGLDHPVALS